MTMSTATTLPPALDEVVSRLASGLQAELIYLFGSQASDLARPGSDYDLLVVVPHSDLPRHEREAISYDLLWGLTIPVDVIVLTHAEFQRQSQVKTSLVVTAKEKGILLYGKPQDR